MSKNNVDKKIRFRAIDNVSAITDKISNKFNKVTRAAAKTQKKFERVSQSSKKLRDNLNKAGKGLKNVGKSMTVGLTAPIAAFGAMAFRTSVQFDKSMNKVQALSRASATEIAALRKQSKLLGSETAFSASQAAEAQAFFAQAGFKTNEILKATPATLALAAATSTDLAQSADILSNVMGGFNVKADQAGRFVDVLSAATARGNINMEMIGETMKDAAPVAQKFGASIEETAALTAKLGDAGIQGSKAGTTLKNMFLNLSAPTTRIKKIMGALGVQTVDPVTGKMRKMTDILVDMNKAFQSKGLKDSQRLAVLNEVFGKRAIAGAGVLLNAVSQVDEKTGKTVNTVAKLTKELENSNGVAKEMEKTMLKGLPGATASFTSAFEALQIAVMDSGIKDVLADIINKVADLFRWIANLNPTILKWGAILAGVVAVIGPMLFIFGGIISALPFLIQGFQLLSVILPVISAGAIPLILAMGKFLLIAGLVAGAAYLIYDAWDDFGNFFNDLFADPLQQLKDMADWAGKIVGLGTFFGDDPDDVDARLKAQGFSFQAAGEASGSATGSRELTKKSNEFKQRQIGGAIDVKFSNMPKDTKVITDDKESILNVSTGMMGAI